MFVNKTKESQARAMVGSEATAEVVRAQYEKLGGLWREDEAPEVVEKPKVERKTSKK